MNSEEKDEIEDLFILHKLKNINDGVRIDIWTHFMRGCIIELCTPV